MLISPSLSPNITKQDVGLSFKLLFQPWKWRSFEPVKLLIDAFAEYLLVSKESVFAVNSARAGMSDILSLYRIGTGDEVIVQGFTCVAVTNSVRWVGATPIIVDIDEHTLNFNSMEVQNHITPKTKVIIVQHTFGLPYVHLSQLIEMAQQKGILVIEDCAHSFGAKIDDVFVGTIADASVFSFGRDKIISSVFGGMVVLKDSAKQQEYRKWLASQQNMGFWWIKRQLLHPITTWISLATYEWFGFGKLWHFILQTIGIISKATSRDEKNSGPRPAWTTKKYPGVLAQLALPQLLLIAKNNNRRNEIAARYAAAGIQSVQSSSQGRVWLRYSILVEKPQAMRTYFAKRGVVLGDWYDQVVAPREVDLSKLGYVVGDAPVAEYVSAHVVNLPTYPRMTDKDVEKVIRLCKEYKSNENK